MRHISRHQIALATLALSAGALAPSAASAGTAATAAGARVASCAAAWGSTPETSHAYSDMPIVNVRAGGHECFDRLVVDVHDAAGYDVRYVDEVYTVGQGEVVPLRGGAKLQVTVFAPTYYEGVEVYRPANPQELVDVTGYGTFRQAATGGSFEGATTLGLGVRARLPFRVFLLGSRNDDFRLVVDVAHRW